MYAFVDLPFSPSGVTHLSRLHKAVGLEKEVTEAVEVLRTVREGNNNVLAVVIAPYGWGKSELLDEIEVIAQREGFDVIRTALSLEHEFVIEVASKKRDKPMLALIDEADEISRMAIAHKLGVLTDERFMKMLQRVATYIRALLEPRSYRHVLGDPERFNKVGIIVALTPQLYYTILKNTVPDVFDITSGRVYKEIVVDTRFAFWHFIEVVKQRLEAYSAEERLAKIRRGELDPLSPFTLHELAALYHLAKRKGDVTPRLLLKLVARLFHYKKEGRRLADLLREEGVNPDVDDELLELAFAGMPHKDEVFAKSSRGIYLYRIPYYDKDAMSAARGYLILRGKDVDLRDPKNVSYEPYLYYTLLEDGVLYVYLMSEENLGSRHLVGRYFAISDDVARRVVGEDLQNVAAVAREYGQKLESPPALLEEIEQTLDVSGIRLRTCCGHAVWVNNMGIREAYLFFHVDRDEELKKAASQLAEVIAHGSLGDYAVDHMAIFVTSKILLTETIQNVLTPLLSTYWKKYYRVPTSGFVTLQIYGADKIEKLKQSLIKYTVGKLLRHEVETPEFINNLRLGREKARENILKYTLALKKGREKKQVALVKMCEALEEGGEVEGMKSYLEIEEILLNAIGDSAHEREVRSLIHTLFPVNLWRELREDDMIELMKLRGVLVPHGDVLYRYREDLARRYLSELLSQLHALNRVSIEKQTPWGTLRVQKQLEVAEIRPVFNSRETYAKALREVLLKLLELKEIYERLKKEAERELEEKIRLLRKVAAVIEKFSQRQKFIDVSNLSEKDVKREEYISQKAEEALRIWNEVRHMARELGDTVDVEKDLAVLLELPQPWLDEYVADLKLYAIDLTKRYEKFLESQKYRKAMLDWLATRLGVVDGDVEKAVALVSTKLGVDGELIKAVARRGRGVLLDLEELSRETGLEKSSVEEQLEKLHKAGLVEKRYVA
ncbi:MAG: ArsR family transcriptional regulator [Pyrobaculum sp.]